MKDLNNGITVKSPAGLPEQLFHYTSLEAMLKIVDTRSIWCTALPYLNDSKERTFLFEAAARRLSILKRLDKTIDPQLELRTLEVDDANDFTSFGEESFVACFAEKRDSLMHWRAYCPHQTGVAIGFKSTCLMEARIAENPKPGMIVPPTSFGRVLYLNTEDDALVDRVIYDAYDMAIKEKKNNQWGDLNAHFRLAMNAIACRSKQQAFEVEDEFRLLLNYVRYRENNLKFRTVRSTLIPYVALALPSDSDSGPDFDWEKQRPWRAVQSIVIGPSANLKLTQKSVEAFFALHRINIELEESQIPYRDW